MVAGTSIYRVITKSLCTWLTCIRTIPTQLMISRWPSQNTFGMWTVLYRTRSSKTQFGVSNIWRLAGNTLNITCYFLYCNHQVHRDLLITLYFIHTRIAFLQWLLDSLFDLTCFFVTDGARTATNASAGRAAEYPADGGGTAASERATAVPARATVWIHSTNMASGSGCGCGRGRGSGGLDLGTLL